MTETGKNQKEQSTVNESRNKLWTRLISYVKCKFQERKAKKDQESPTDRAARKTADATFWIARFTLVLALVGSWQLYELHSGSADTRKAANAADLAARTAYAEMFSNRKFAAETLHEMQKQSTAMDHAATAAGNQAAGIKESNRISRESLNKSRDLFVRGERPYVTVSKAFPAQRTTVDTIGCTVEYTNFGKSPALHLTKTGWIFYGDDAYQQANEWFKRFGNQTLAEFNKTDPHPTVLIENDLMQGDHADVPIPGIIPSTAPLTGYYVAVMRLQYYDGFGNRYWSDFCAFHVKNDSIGPMIHCLNHNLIHQEGERESTKEQQHP